jgi:hypothetical protein
MSVTHLPTYRSILGLSIRFPRGGLSFLTRMCILKDSTFQYDFGGDLFSDEAIGILKAHKKDFILIYLTPSYHITDSVSETKTIMTNPPTTVNYKVPFRWENPIAHIRPLEIKCTRNKLFILKTKDTTTGSNLKKNKLKKVAYNKWIKYGSIVVD